MASRPHWPPHARVSPENHAPGTERHFAGPRGALVWAAFGLLILAAFGAILWIARGAPPVPSGAIAAVLCLLAGMALGASFRGPAPRAAAAADVDDARYRLLTACASDGILHHVDGIVTFANERMAAIVGASAPEELVGWPLAKLPGFDEIARDRTLEVVSARVPADASTLVVVRDRTAIAA